MWKESTIFNFNHYISYFNRKCLKASTFCYYLVTYTKEQFILLIRKRKEDNDFFPFLYLEKQNSTDIFLLENKTKETLNNNQNQSLIESFSC